MADHKEHDEPAEGEDGEGQKKGRFTPKMMMIGGGAVVGLLVVLGLVYFLFLSGPSTESAAKEGEHGAASAEHGAAEEGHKAEAKEGGHGEKGESVATGSAEASQIIELDDMVVNLSTLPGKRASYLKLKVAIEIAKPELRPEMEKQKPRIVDTFQVYLCELRTEDLQGSVGIVRLKEELLARVTAAVAPIEVRDVLFKELLVQ